MPNFPSPSFNDYQFLDVLASLITPPSSLSPHFIISCKSISVGITKIKIFYLNTSQIVPLYLQKDTKFLRSAYKFL